MKKMILLLSGVLMLSNLSMARADVDNGCPALQGFRSYSLPRLNVYRSGQGGADYWEERVDDYERIAKQIAAQLRDIIPTIQNRVTAASLTNTVRAIYAVRTTGSGGGYYWMNLADSVADQYLEIKIQIDSTIAAACDQEQGPIPQQPQQGAGQKDISAGDIVRDLEGYTGRVIFVLSNGQAMVKFDPFQGLPGGGKCLEATADSPAGRCWEALGELTRVLGK